VRRDLTQALASCLWPIGGEAARMSIVADDARDIKTRWRAHRGVALWSQPCEDSEPRMMVGAAPQRGPTDAATMDAA